MTQAIYNLTNIRELLIQGFNDSELYTLCFGMPRFRPVYHELGSNTGKAEIVAKLLEHAAGSTDPGRWGGARVRVLESALWGVVNGVKSVGGEG